MITTLGFPTVLCLIFVYFLLYEHPKRELSIQIALQKTLADLNANIQELTILIKNNNLSAFVVELKKDVAEVKEEAIRIKERLCK